MYARVINVCDPGLLSLLWGRAKDLDQFDKYLETLEDHAISEACRGRHVFSKGEPVIARCSTIGWRWMNGVLGEPLGCGHWEMSFRMFSATEVVKEQDIVPKPFDLMDDRDLTVRFITCSVDGSDSVDVDSSDWPPECLAYFKEHVEGRTLKVAYMEMRNKLNYIDLLVGDESGQLVSLKLLMQDRGFFKVGKGLDPNGHQGGHSRDDLPASTNDTDLDEICLMMNISKDEYLTMKKSEDMSYDLSKYPTIEELISNSLSINNRPPNHHGAFAAVGARTANRKGPLGRGRGCLTGLVDWGREFCVDDFKSSSCQQLSRKKAVPKVMELEASLDVGMELEDQLDMILSREANNDNLIYEIMNCIGIESRMITSPAEDKVVRCLRHLLNRCTDSGTHTSVCVEFVGQVVARSKDAVGIWAEPFHSAYKRLLKNLDARRARNFSLFMVDVYLQSRLWLDTGVRNLIVGDIFMCLGRTIDEIAQLGVAVNARQDALVCIITNFMSSVLDACCDRRHFDDDNGDIKFKRKMKNLLKSKDLPKHILNLFETIIDPDSVCGKYAMQRPDGLSIVAHDHHYSSSFCGRPASQMSFQPRNSSPRTTVPRYRRHDKRPVNCWSRKVSEHWDDEPFEVEWNKGEQGDEQEQQNSSHVVSSQLATEDVQEFKELGQGPLAAPPLADHQSFAANNHHVFVVLD